MSKVSPNTAIARKAAEQSFNPIGKTVLIVDDNSLNVDLLSKTLFGHYKTVEAGDGLKALAIVEHQPIDVIVSDVLMPNLDGYGLCKEIRSRPELKEMFFILYTATSFTANDEKSALECGADRFIYKEGTPKVILKAIGELFIGDHQSEFVVPMNDWASQAEMKSYNSLMIRQTEESSIQIEQARIDANRRLRSANKRLQTEIVERDLSNQEIRKLNLTLECRVADLTAVMGALQSSQRTLHETKNFLESVVENIPIMIFIKEAQELRFTRINKAGERLLGYSREELLGKNDCHFFSNEEASSFLSADRKTLDAGRMLLIEEESIHTKHGEKKVLRTRKIPLLGLDGAPQYLLGISEDITERMQIERALDEKNIELQHASAAKDRFLTDMSHELRTPLNGIIGFSEFLFDGKPGPLNPKQKEYLGDILNSGKHLLQLINNILDLAKVEAGKMELQPERFSIREAIEEVCAVTKPIAQKQSIDISIEITPGLPEIILDRQKFQQILYNLISNAIKFSGDGCKVEILASPEDELRFKLIVKESGIGIKPDDLRRLFTAYEQLESSVSSLQKGTGLGLVLTRQIVELQGGMIKVESEFGKGSMFTVVLPLCAAKT